MQDFVHQTNDCQHDLLEPVLSSALMEQFFLGQRQPFAQLLGVSENRDPNIVPYIIGSLLKGPQNKVP